MATAALNGTVTEIENKIPGITNLDILDHGTTYIKKTNDKPNKYILLRF